MKFSFYIIFSVLSGLFSPLHATSFSVENDTCRPSYSDIFNFDVGDVFQYREFSTSSAGGLNPTNEVITQFIILDKNIDSNIVSYYVNGWKEALYYQNSSNEEPSDSDTTRDFEFIDEYYVFIDSVSNFLNLCPKEVILLQNKYFLEMGLENIFSRVQTSYSDTNLIKTIGGQSNVLQYNENDSLVPINDMYFEAVYRQGLGLISQEFNFLEIRETIELEAYVKGQDTVGILLPGEYPDYQASSIKNYTPSKSVHLYPNPTRDILNIESPNQEVISAEIFNINGQKVHEEYLPAKQIDISFLKSGIYFIRLKINDNQYHSEKLFIF